MIVHDLNIIFPSVYHQYFFIDITLLLFYLSDIFFCFVITTTSWVYKTSLALKVNMQMN